MATKTSNDHECLLRLNTIKGDLFSSPSEASLAHCVSEDLRMGKGIATIFKRKFGGVRELSSQGEKVGGCAVLKRNQRYVFYLITKSKYWHKPTYDTLRKSLEGLKTHLTSKGVKHLCIPKIGCGLDKLEWGYVKSIVREVFEDLDLEIDVYHL